MTETTRPIATRVVVRPAIRVVLKGTPIQTATSAPSPSRLVTRPVTGWARAGRAEVSIGYPPALAHQADQQVLIRLAVRLTLAAPPAPHRGDGSRRRHRDTVVTAGHQGIRIIVHRRIIGVKDQAFFRAESAGGLHNLRHHSAR